MNGITCPKRNRSRQLAPLQALTADAPQPRFRLCGSVLPTVMAVSVVMLTALLGLLMIWGQERMLFARVRRLRQARADAESAYTLYRLHADAPDLTISRGYRLYDSLPGSCVAVRAEPWGLYEAVHVRTADSLVRLCRLFGAEPEPRNTLYYVDNRSALTLAGRTVLQGTLAMPQNGFVYGRVASDLFCGPEILRSAIVRSKTRLPEPEKAARIDSLFTAVRGMPAGLLPNSLCISFLRDSAAILPLGDAEVADCSLRGKIILCGGELRIDSTCWMEHLLVVARKIIVGSGARIRGQFFARDTLVVEPRAILGYPSGIYAGAYAELGDRAEVDGYAIVRDTLLRKKVSACYRQSRTARLRGLLWVDGAAQVQGIVSGRALLRQAVYFSPRGYYGNMLYDLTLLENPVTVQPLWLSPKRRKEAACVD